MLLQLPLDLPPGPLQEFLEQWWVINLPPFTEKNYLKYYVFILAGYVTGKYPSSDFKVLFFHNLTLGLMSIILPLAKYVYLFYLITFVKGLSAGGLHTGRQEVSIDKQCFLKVFNCENYEIPSNM